MMRDIYVALHRALGVDGGGALPLCERLRN
jgi:hypothetical protein